MDGCLLLPLRRWLSGTLFRVFKIDSSSIVSDIKNKQGDECNALPAGCQSMNHVMVNTNQNAKLMSRTLNGL